MQLRIRRLKFYLKEMGYRNIGGKSVFYLFMVTNLVYGIMLLVTIPKVMSYSGGMKIFDMMPLGYSSQYANSLLGKLGIEGRNAYLFTQLPVDFIYPFLFGITYTLLLAYFLRRLGSLKDVYFYLCLLPIIAGVFDYSENFGIISMLISYPHSSEIVIQLTSCFTVLKSLITTLYFVVLIFVLMFFIVRELYHKVL